MKAVLQKDIEYFIEDFERKSSIELLEGAKEKSELNKIAEARGIKIKGSRDLVAFKTIYAFTDRPNKNGAVLPEKALLKVLPQIVGKPISVNHNRRFVVGHYIDYRYIQKSKQIIAYGVFYKSNFGAEYEKAKTLFKNKKLSSSFEIWSPNKATKFREDGSYELHQMEIAGGALIFQDADNEPAFDGADVMMLAKKQADDLELVYASKHKENEIVGSSMWKESIEDNLKKVETDANPVTNMKCNNCDNEFETTDLTSVKCPSCFSILKSDGSVLYPPQIQDFKMACPSCHVSNWLITSSKENISELKCQSCAKEYTVEFAVPEKSELLGRIKFLYVGQTSCPQCGSSIPLSGTSDMTEHEVSCKKCGLTFKVNTEKLERSRQIKSIVEKTLEERRTEEDMKNKEEKKKDVDVKDEITPVEDVKPTEEKKDAPKAEAPKEEENKDVKATAKENSDVVVKSSEEKPDGAPEQADEISTPKPSEENSTDTSKATATEQPADKPQDINSSEESNEETTPAVIDKTTEVKTPKDAEAQDETKNDEIEAVDVDDEMFENLVQAKTLSKKDLSELTDQSFGLVQVVKSKSTDKKRKIRMFPIQDKAGVRNALARLPLATKVLGKLNVDPRNVKATILRKAKVLGMKDVVRNHMTTARNDKMMKTLLDNAVAKIVELKDAKTIELKNATAEATTLQTAEVEKIKKEADEKIELIKANAKIVVERQLELGSYAEDIEDKDIVNDDVYEKIKLTKSNAELRAINKGGDDVVSAKTDMDHVAKEITEKAFGDKRRDQIA